MTPPLWVALVHHPVLNRERKVITTAITNLDLHDIARAARTYELRRYYVVTPIERQRELARRICSHWVEGHGAERVPERAEAMRLLTTVDTVEAAVEGVTEEAGERPCVVASCARPGRATVGYGEISSRIQAGRPILLMLGTGWGLTDDALGAADEILEPISARGSDYNHLSVRCAAAIMMDRLLGDHETSS